MAQNGNVTTFHCKNLKDLEAEIHVNKVMKAAAWRRRRRKFTTSVQPAKAYEDESVIMSGPHSQWPRS